MLLLSSVLLTLISTTLSESCNHLMQVECISTVAVSKLVLDLQILNNQHVNRSNANDHCRVARARSAVYSFLPGRTRTSTPGRSCGKDGGKQDVGGHRQRKGNRPKTPTKTYKHPPMVQLKSQVSTWLPQNNGLRQQTPKTCAQMPHMPCMPHAHVNMWWDQWFIQLHVMWAKVRRLRQPRLATSLLGSLASTASDA